jgi:DNA-binding XRE family transcriptional regulator
VAIWKRGDRAVARYHWPAIGAALDLQPDEVGALFAGQPLARLDGERLPSLGSLRRAAGLHQRVVADRVGVAPTTLSMWETGKVRVPASMGPSWQTLWRPTSPG